MNKNNIKLIDFQIIFNQSINKDFVGFCLVILYPIILQSFNSIIISNLISQMSQDGNSDSYDQKTLYDFNSDEEIQLQQCLDKIYDKSYASGMHQSSILCTNQQIPINLTNKKSFTQSFYQIFKPLQVYRKGKLSNKSFRQSLSEPGKSIKTFQQLRKAHKNINVQLCNWMLQKNPKYLKIKKLLSDHYLSFGINVEFKFVDDWRLIHFICLKQRKISLELLLEYHPQVDIYAETNLKITPLHLCARQGNKEMLEMLIIHIIRTSNNLRLNIKDSIGNTPLHYAFKNNSKQTSQLLLKFGADPFIENIFKFSPLNMCTKYDIFKLIYQTNHKKQMKKNLQMMKQFKSKLKTQLTAATEYQIERRYTKRTTRRVQYYLMKIPEIVSLTDFEEIRFLEKGTFSRVLLVKKINRKENEPKFYAMKIVECTSLRRQFGANMKTLLQTQKNILSLPCHPFIIKLYYAFFSKNRYIFVIEYAQNGTLQQMIQSNQWKKYSIRDRVKFTKKYACELILALQYLHKHKITHRDLKTNNIVIKEDGHLKIIDFGLCSLKELMQTKIGPSDFKAPQIIINQENCFYTYKCDMFYLGIILYKMVCLSNPFPSTDDLQELRKIYKSYDESSKINTIRTVKFDSSIDTDCKQFINKLLKIRPYHRFQSYQQIKAHNWFDDIDWQDVYEKRLSLCNIELQKNYLPKSVKQQSGILSLDSKSEMEQIQSVFIPSEFIFEDPEQPQQ